MSRSQSELSLTQREILQLIIYRTKNPKHTTFFGDNEYIAKCVNVKPDTVRKAVNELIKLEYLVQGKDKRSPPFGLYRQRICTYYRRYAEF